MFIRLAYLKMVRPNQSQFSPASAVTTFIETRTAKIDPLGGTGVNAPSTLLSDDRGNQFYINKTFSSVNAVITAVTSTADNISIL